ncbi:MAG: hypothetical protein ABH822_00440 [Patescibacteria group bacterium]
MRLDLVFIYLVNRFWYRLFSFFKNWYWHSLLNVKKVVEAVFWWTDNVPVVKWISRVVFIMFAIFVYVVWAMIPIYLVLRLL